MRIIHYYSKLFTSLLKPGAAAGDAPGTSSDAGGAALLSMLRTFAVKEQDAAQAELEQVLNQMALNPQLKGSISKLTLIFHPNDQTL